MKYAVEMQGRLINVELEQKDRRVEARVGQRHYDLEVVSPELGVLTFLDGDRIYEARVWIREPGSLRVTIGGQSFSTSVIDPKHRRLAIEHGFEGRQNLVAPMPGKVIRVLVAAGDDVALGQGIVVVEAMKMQNEIKSPKAGRVLEVRVAEGSNVDANQILAVVE